MALFIFSFSLLFWFLIRFLPRPCILFLFLHSRSCSPISHLVSISLFSSFPSVATPTEQAHTLVSLGQEEGGKWLTLSAVYKAHYFIFTSHIITLSRLTCVMHALESAKYVTIHEKYEVP
jgi:hypothetical protein